MISLDDILNNAGVKPTSNRILVLRAILSSPRPLSLGELDEQILTLDKSSILRTLNLLIEHHILHTVEDGRGIVKYEICHGDGQSCAMHVHFYCEHCQKTFCFPDTPVPDIPLPDGFTPRAVNYMLKGTCPECSKKS